MALITEENAVYTRAASDKNVSPDSPRIRERASWRILLIRSKTNRGESSMFADGIPAISWSQSWIKVESPLNMRYAVKLVSNDTEKVRRLTILPVNG